MSRPLRQPQPAAPTTARRGPVTLLIFVSGAVLMALEIAGSRVLAPFFGSSVFVWGSLIGIFLGAMSGGYWLGGWLSERWPRQVLLNALLAAAGAFTLLLPLWAAPLCQALAGGPEGWVDLGPRLGPLTAALGLFLLGMIIMTERLREMAGDAVRSALMRFTSSPTSGAVTGAVSTAILQSSSAGIAATMTALPGSILTGRTIPVPLPV